MVFKLHDIMLTVPWCVDDPARVPNANPIEVVKNRTISYSCDEGYESSHSQEQSVNINCSSPDTENEPWRWNDTSIEGKFNCNPGKLLQIHLK